jgi:hypothetical protein
VYDVSNSSGSSSSITVGGLSLSAGQSAQVTDTDCDGQVNQVDTDDDNDGLSDALETGCGTNPLSVIGVPERLDGPFDNVDDDADTAVDEVLPGTSPTFDCDGDGWAGNQENLIYLNAPGTVADQDPCGAEWPSNLAAPASNVLNIGDVLSFTAPSRLAADFGSGGAFNMFGHDLDDDGDTVIETTEDPGAPGGPTFNVARWNLQLPPHATDTTINIGDLNALITGAVGSPARPPMFNGQQAFFTAGGMCPWPA